MGLERLFQRCEVLDALFWEVCHSERASTENFHPVAALEDHDDIHLHEAVLLVLEALRDSGERPSAHSAATHSHRQLDELVFV